MTLEDLMKFDSLKESEKILGIEDSNLGLFLHIDNMINKDNILNELGDTTYGTKVTDYITIAQQIGFHCVYKEQFHSTKWNKDDCLYIMWHPEGVVLKFDTFGDKPNAGSFYYNWKPNGKERPTESGAWNFDPAFPNDESQMIWSGDNDCREALKYKMEKLKKYGRFFNPWKVKPHLFLLHYEDNNKVDKLDSKGLIAIIDIINTERISKLPEAVRKCMGF